MESPRWQALTISLASGSAPAILAAAVLLVRDLSRGADRRVDCSWMCVVAAGCWTWRACRLSSQRLLEHWRNCIKVSKRDTVPSIVAGLRLHGWRRVQNDGYAFRYLLDTMFLRSVIFHGGCISNLRYQSEETGAGHSNGSRASSGRAVVIRAHILCGG